jgi:hypothetical protein
MRFITTFAPLQQIFDTFLNQFQLETVGLRLADTANALTSGTDGADIIYTQTNAQATAGNSLVIDSSVDWRDRTVLVFGWGLVATQRMGEADDFQVNDPTSMARQIIQIGYTGSGGLSDLTTGAPVSPGNPPLNGAGVYRSYAPVIYRQVASPTTFDDLYLYADATTGYLTLYNTSGTSLYFTGIVLGVAQSGQRP